MTLGPWLVWYPALALINLLIFIAIRGRWSRSVLALAAAALIGVVVGDRVAEATGLELLRIGDMNVLGASIGAQAFMVAITLLSALGPIEIRDREQ
jgi:hypothetical protein